MRFWAFLLLFGWTLHAASLPEVLDRVEKARLEGQYEKALAILADLEREEPALFDLNNLPYLQAVLLAESGEKLKANEILTEVLAAPFPLPDRVRLRLIDNSAELPFEARRPFYSGFLTAFPGHPQWGKVALEYADGLRAAEQTADAISWYQKVAASSAAFGRTAQLRWATVLIDQNQRSAVAPADSGAVATKLLRQLIDKKNDDTIASESARLLFALENAPDLSEDELAVRARALVIGRQWKPARSHLAYLVGKYQKSPQLAEYRYLLARCSELQAGDAKAGRSYEQVYADFPQGRWGIYALYRAGMLYLRLADYTSAGEAFRQIAEKHPDSPYFGNAVLELADSMVWRGQRAEAESTVKAALEKGRLTDKSRLHYWLARLLVEQGRHEDALEQLAPLEGLRSDQLPSGVTSEEVHYWVGLALRKVGQEERASESFRRSAAGRRNYFSFLSEASLPAPVSRPAEKATAQPPKLRDDLIVARPVITSEANRPDDSKQKELERVRELLFLRLYDEAYRESNANGQAKSGLSKENFLFHLSNWAGKGGLYWDSINNAEKLQRAISDKLGFEYMGDELIPLLYPRPYWSIIEEHSRRNGLDPFLVAALIRQESGFTRTAKSPVAARGLMQIMFPTGKELARRVGIRLRNAERLYEPALSIQLGCLYLKELVGRYNGVTEKVLAAYNGGIGNVGRWERKVSSTDPPVFVANIGFRETKLYVLKVVGNYNTYRQLYGSQRAEATN